MRGPETVTPGRRGRIDAPSGRVYYFLAMSFPLIQLRPCARLLQAPITYPSRGIEL